MQPEYFAEFPLRQFLVNLWICATAGIVGVSCLFLPASVRNMSLAILKRMLCYEPKYNIFES
jgi:hypothetical protein